MKLNFTTLIFAIAVCAFCFTSCKKDSFKTTAKNTTTIDLNEAAASQLAVSFYNSVTGAYGGAELKNGIKISSVDSLSKNGLVLLSTNPLCGMKFDTIANKIIKVKDTTVYHNGGHYSTTYTCSGASPDGYKNNNSFFTTLKTTNTLDSLHVVQQYTVKALNKTYKLLSLNGTMETWRHKQVFNGPFYPNPFGANLMKVNTDIIEDHTHYTLNNIKIDHSGSIPDMISGTSKSTDAHVVQNKDNPLGESFYTYYSTITFLGKHLARVEVQIGFDYGPPSPKIYVYIVNVLTGQIVH